MIHIITHAYAIEHPQYAVFLRSQLSSLYKYRPDVPFKITVCCLQEDKDERIEEVLRDFDKYIPNDVYTHRMEPAALFRRAVGRNEVAMKSDADLVWFCDADYFIGDGCLDSIWESWNGFEEPKPVFIWPRVTFIHRTHEIGDSVWKRYEGCRLPIYPDVFKEDFKKMRYDFAIGGLQIMNGNFARSEGYLNDTKWTKPEEWTGPVTTAEDVKFRKMCKPLVGGDAAIEVPNLFRLRHSETGLSKRERQPRRKRK